MEGEPPMGAICMSAGYDPPTGNIRFASELPSSPLAAGARETLEASKRYHSRIMCQDHLHCSPR